MDDELSVAMRERGWSEDAIDLFQEHRHEPFVCWWKARVTGKKPTRQRPRQQKVFIPYGLRWKVWERDNFTCQGCSIRSHLSVDHIIPESKGGTLDMSNLQTLCRWCNSRKGAR